MKEVKDYIDSGILELYVMGGTTPRESKEVEELLLVSSKIRKEINEIQAAMEAYAQAHAVIPNPTIKPFLMAAIDYADRMKNGWQPGFPPLINADSKISDYTDWITQPGMELPADFKEVHAKIIAHTPEVLTAIVWIKSRTPHETHTREFEHFLILEGTCDITIEDNVHHLVAGNVFSIPLYKDHTVTVTSKIPCKVLLQRVAA